MDASAIKEVMSLESKTLIELREMWRRLFKSDAPLYSRKYLIKRLAYHLQEIAYGGLCSKAAKKLDYLRDQLEQGKKISSSTINCPIAGTTLIRQYQGVNHEVSVTKKGFTYQGQFFKSLSAIANKITGTRWNGLVFFGVKSVKAS
ncbi:DUF2924 domain-containing protein [Candidatus Mesenet endosymbiont of Phosphuga atrata]|uniref:DUF2924 domain-containing protein n=1 Tax=Candidatus Mesenet endosymbiont of Phosphuga atrata TaxID=3066221 RepID=UPI0030CE0EB9